MYVYPTIKVEVSINSNWIDITQDIVSNITGAYGILGSRKVDKLGNVGSLSFTMRNDRGCSGGVDNYYTPNHRDSLSGWKSNIKIRLMIIYNPDTICKWYGTIKSIDINPIQRLIKIEALDYFDYFTNYRLNLVNVSSDKKLADVVDLILSGMPIQPLNKQHYPTTEVYVSAFDSIRDNTRALTELQRLISSEWGFIFLKHGLQPETLVTEGRRTRNFLSKLTKIPKNGYFLQKEDGGYLLLQNGSKLMLNISQETTFENNALSFESNSDDDIVNRVIVKSYPRVIGTSNVVLYSLGNSSPIYLNAGESRKVIGSYRDPDQRAQAVAGINMISPVSGCANDYCMYSTPISGSGTDLTAGLDVSTSFSATSATFNLTNNNGIPGYITKLQVRGIPILIYQSLDYLTEDNDSIIENGIKELTIDQKYQSNEFLAASLARVLLKQLKQSSLKINKVNFLANINNQLLMSFLYLEPGSLIYLRNSDLNLDKYYYINGVEFDIHPKGIIYFNWYLTDALSLTETYWILGTSRLGIETVLGP